MGKAKPTAGKTILVADDEPEVTQTLTAYLTSLGYKALAVADGDAAMKTIEESQPDLVILDIAMPKASGIVVTRQLRAHPDLRLREIPVIMLTAKSDPRHEAYSDEAGADAFIPKPVALAEVARKIRELL